MDLMLTFSNHTHKTSRLIFYYIMFPAPTVTKQQSSKTTIQNYGHTVCYTQCFAN
jgi:hypothetical protein